MLALDLAYGLEQVGQFVKALLLGRFGKTCVHIGPLVIFALGGVQQVGSGIGDGVAVQGLEPQLGMFLLIGSRLLKDLGNLHIAVLAGLGSVESVLVAGLALAGKSSHQVLFGFRSFQFHGASSFPHSVNLSIAEQ